jgi:hypothetical protein
MAAYRSDRFNITGDGVPEPVRGLRVSHELFSVLGVSRSSDAASINRSSTRQAPSR